jgi:4-methylaminobutanoate oxidase (formaldehyde-forming)
MQTPSEKRDRHADILIIGGGIVGCSLAYHLTRMGRRDVVILEKSGVTHGATWHAAGLVGQLRSSRNTTRMLKYSVELYDRLEKETGMSIDWKPVGSLRLSCSAERDLENLRLLTMARSFDLEMQLLTPEEALKLFPVMSLTDVRSALFVPSDGYIDPSSVCQALAKGARDQGARVVEGERVTGFKVTNRRIEKVLTDRGEWTSDCVVNAAGMWAHEIGQLAGVRVPAFALEHQFLVTDAIDDLPKGMPTMRDPDHLVYYKQEINSLVIGGYEDNTLAFARLGIRPSFAQELLPENFDRFEPLALNAAKRTPVVNTVGVRKLINGPIPYSADGDFVMGKAPELENFYVTSGFLYGIAAGGGAGRMMAEWILHGSPELNLWPLDIRRFSFHHNTRHFMYSRAEEIYGKHYKLRFPGDEHETVRGVRRSPLYGTLKAHGAVYGSRAGWERPNWFAPPGIEPKDRLSFNRFETNFFHAVGDEHRRVREKVALIDQSSFSKFEIIGPDALSLLQYLTVSDLNKPVGATIYTQLCNARGGIECDLTLSRLGENHFYVVTGSAFGTHDRHWIESHLRERSAQATVVDMTSARAVLGLCGPDARRVLQKVVEEDLTPARFPFSSCRHLTLGAAPVLAIRIGYVGELGWELHIPTEYTQHVYGLLSEAGEPYGIADVGYRAIDSLRLEKRYLYWSTDITPDHTPYEAGLDFRVHLKKGEFLGREALVKQKERGINRKLFTLVLDKPLSLYGGEAVRHRGKVVSVTTSGGFGYTVGKSLAYAYLPLEIAAEPAGLEVESFGAVSPATIADGAVYDPKSERLRA